MSQDEVCQQASAVQISKGQILNITLLASEWKSTAGGLSTLNRELAINLSQIQNVRVSLLVPEDACNDEDKMEAKRFGISILDAKKCVGLDPLVWLSNPPQDHKIDVIVGHGVKLGCQVQLIKRQAQFQHCKWVHVVHTAPEHLSKYKGYSDPISKGEKKLWDEVDLCKCADLVVPVGPKLRKAYHGYLQKSKKDEDFFELIPGLFEREFGDLPAKQNPKDERDDFIVLLCGRGDEEDFELKGYNIAVEAFADQRLKGKHCSLFFVGSPEGKQDEVQERLLNCGIDKKQLTVREFVKSRERMKELFCEVDMVIMPSKSEGFGLVALEALSAGLPILVGKNSGFARAIEVIPLGYNSIVDSDDPAKWAECVEGVRVRHQVVLQENKILKEHYGKAYCWKKQCEELVDRLWKMVYGLDRKLGKIQRSKQQLPSVSSETFHELYSAHKNKITEEEKALATYENKEYLREFGGEADRTPLFSQRGGLDPETSMIGKATAGVEERKMAADPNFANFVADLDRALRNVNSESEKNETAFLMMFLNMNWAELLTSAQLSIARLGQLMLVAGEKDFSLENQRPKKGFQFIQHPESFRACLVQVSRSGWRAFNEAHKNMDAIRLYSAEVLDQVNEVVPILVKGSEKDVEDFLPIELGKIDRNATECLQLAQAVEAKFKNVMYLTRELLEVFSAAGGYYEKKTGRKKESLGEYSPKKIANFDKITETLRQGFEALASVLEQWKKLVEFCMIITSRIGVCHKESLSSFFEYVKVGQKRVLANGYASTDFMRDLINEPVSQANTTSYAVWSISNTYVEIFRDHLMSRIASLGHLIALDPEKDRVAIEAKRNDFMEGSQEAQEAQEAIRKYVSEAKDHFHEKVTKRVKKIETKLLKAPPSF